MFNETDKKDKQKRVKHLDMGNGWCFIYNYYLSLIFANESQISMYK